MARNSKIVGGQIMSGTWGEVWLDNEYVGECYKLQAKSSFEKEDIKLCGQMAVDKKINNVSNTGSMGMYHLNSRMVQVIGEHIRNGEDPRFTVISKLSDPSASGAERVVLKNVSFDDLTLADWEVGVAGKIEAPFTFTDYEFLDMAEV